VPGNLEAPLILPEHAYGVKQKTLTPQRFLPNNRGTEADDPARPENESRSQLGQREDRVGMGDDPPAKTADHHQAGVKGAEGGEANP
jgi:hypothetical protein